MQDITMCTMVLRFKFCFTATEARLFGIFAAVINWLVKQGTIYYWLISERMEKAVEIQLPLELRNATIVASSIINPGWTFEPTR